MNADVGVTTTRTAPPGRQYLLERLPRGASAEADFPWAIFGHPYGMNYT